MKIGKPELGTINNEVLTDGEMPSSIENTIGLVKGEDMARTKTTSSRRKTTESNKMPEMTMESSSAASRYNPAITTDGPYSLASLVNGVVNNVAVILFVGLAFLGGMISGSLWTENQLIKNGVGTVANAGQVQPAAAQPVAPEGPTEDQLKKAPKVSDDDFIKGNKNAEIVLVEYSDFECPFCARFHPTMQEVAKTYGDKVAWVMRHYPLSFHPNAQKAAEGAECAAELGGKNMFWTYGDKLFEENNTLGGRLTPEVIITSAEAVGLNKDAFQKCLDSGKYAAKVKKDMDGGTAAGINGTPGTILMTKDGKVELISGALPVDQVKATIDSYLK